ncbi:uncharacterized protein K02A2.6-like isoform X1 [Uranotaenia lowii]|uniref:uncharacterized protein K02A2.6-like isoform X1 n=1 Tax=Uranotaenia lowii TaxID=190385 RepID=UPI002479B519|nr:uncharacterized protein K02A2.6-like isoform X1 [Uranotaenia lowii]
MKNMNIPLNKNNLYLVTDYNSNAIQIHGRVELPCYDPYTRKTKTAPFLVVDSACEPLIGLKSCIDFGLVSRLDSIKTNIPCDLDTLLKCNSDLFEGLGKFPGTCTIQLKENSIPVLHYKKRIPMSLHERLKVDLNSMVQANIITPVDYPTDWVNNMQIVEKPNGSLRICLDPKPLNACIKREHFLIPKGEDILCRMSGKQIFTVLDLQNGFWQMELDRKSSDLTTFMTPFGRFRWNRVPFGISSAPEMFQKRMVQLFGDIPGVEVYFDDILIAGSDFTEHDCILTIVLQRARDNNIRFNSSKVQYRTKRVKFMGHIITAGQVEPDQSYIQAIINMPKPQNKSDVLRLLGLFKYLGKFIPNLSQRTASLRNLTRNDSVWEWTEHHNSEYENLLSSITTTPVLSLFDPRLPIEIQTDSSKHGLGSVILQQGRPVAYASRTLSGSEQKWAQIEKELLAIVFACEKFHHFLYGRNFKVQSDHKPLETLIKRDIDEVTPRLQRMFLHLLKYPGLSVVYTPGKDMLIADCLSRAPLSDSTDFDVQLSGMVHSLAERACLSLDNYQMYIEALNKDEQYRRIVSYVESSWPPYHQLDDLSQMFYKYKDCLHFEEGLLFKDHRLVIPTVLQERIARWLHAPHMGIEKTLARARCQFFWPGMTNNITELVKSCEVCERFTRNIQKEPLHQQAAPEYPFHYIGTDLYEYAGHNYVVVIDAYSGFILSESLREKSASHVIEVLDKMFCRYGYPTIIRSDNVPFNSSAFCEYANKCNLQFKFSSPRYPQSNGLAEKGVAIAKNILKRCYESGDKNTFQYRLLEYNTTPVASMGYSPSQLFFGRMIKTHLPIAPDLLIRNCIDEKEVQKKRKQKRANQKLYYDRSAKHLPPLNIGEKVIFRKNAKEWHYGIVYRIVNERSYVIKDYIGNFFRRNRRFIAKTQNSGFDSSDILFEDHLAKLVNNNEKQIQIVPLPNQSSPENLAVEPEVIVKVENESPNTSIYFDAYEDSENSYDVKLEVDPIPDIDPLMLDTSIHNDHQSYKTRSGRVVRPPKRYELD